MWVCCYHIPTIVLGFRIWGPQFIPFVLVQASEANSFSPCCCLHFPADVHCCPDHCQRRKHTCYEYPERVALVLVMFHMPVLGPLTRLGEEVKNSTNKQRSQTASEEASNAPQAKPWLTSEPHRKLKHLTSIFYKNCRYLKAKL